MNISLNNITIPSNLYAQELLKYFPLLMQISRICREEPTDIQVKSHQYDVVTSGDLAIHTYVVQIFQQMFPGSNLISEEDPDTHHIDRSGDVVFLDPIDGTWNFLTQGSQYGTLVSHWKDGKPVESLIFQPQSGRLLLVREQVLYIDFFRSKAEIIEPRVFTPGTEYSAILSLVDHQDHYDFCKALSLAGSTSNQSMVETAFQMALNFRHGYFIQSRGKCWDYAALYHLLSVLGFSPHKLYSFTLSPWEITENHLGMVAFLTGDVRFKMAFQKVYDEAAIVM